MKGGEGKRSLSPPRRLTSSILAFAWEKKRSLNVLASPRGGGGGRGRELILSFCRGTSLLRGGEYGRGREDRSALSHPQGEKKKGGGKEGALSFQRPCWWRRGGDRSVAVDGPGGRKKRGMKILSFWATLKCAFAPREEGRNGMVSRLIREKRGKKRHYSVRRQAR